MTTSDYWRKRATNLKSRRWFLKAGGAAGFGLAAGASVGCGDDDGDQGDATTAPGSSTPSPAVEQPRRGGQARVVRTSEDPTNDPQVNATNNPLIWAGFVSDHLLNFEADSLALESEIVTDWEYSDDTTLVLKIREGVKFQDKPPANGRDMTADDVAYTIDRARSDDPQILYRARFSNIESVEVPDATTVRLRLARPQASLITYLATNPVLNRESIEAIGGVIKDANDAIGTGPFMVTEYVHGSGGTMVRNPSYWIPEQPYLDGVKWSIIGDVGTINSAFIAGELDFGGVVSGAVDSVGKKQLEGANRGIEFVKVPVTYPVQLLLNMSRPPFDDPRVRKAVDLAVDRQGVIRTAIFGDAEISGPIWDGFLPGYGMPEQELANRPGFRSDKDEDLSEAKALLEAAGHGSGLDVPADGSELTSWINLDPLVASVDQLSKIGLRVQVQDILDRATFLNRANEGSAKFRSYAAAAAVESHDQLRIRYHSASPRNYERYSDVDAMIEKQDSLLDEEQRKALSIDIQRKILDDVAGVHIFWAWQYAVIQRWMRGVKPYVHDRAFRRPGEWWRVEG